MFDSMAAILPFHDLCIAPRHTILSPLMNCPLAPDRINHLRGKQD